MPGSCAYELPASCPVHGIDGCIFGGIFGGICGGSCGGSCGGIDMGLCGGIIEGGCGKNCGCGGGGGITPKEPRCTWAGGTGLETAFSPSCGAP